MQQDPLYPELACLLTAIRLNDYNDILLDDATVFEILYPFAISKSINLQKKDRLIKKLEESGKKEKINAIVKKTIYKTFNNENTMNSISAWGRLYFNDNTHKIKLIQPIYSQEDINKYRRTIKQLTILTTEKK